MRNASLLRIWRWLLSLMAVIVCGWLSTRPDGTVASSLRTGPVELWVGANGALALNDEPVTRIVWIDRLKLTAIQVPQPVIRISAASDTSYGVVHKAFHEAWTTHLMHIGYAVSGHRKSTVLLTDLTEQQYRQNPPVELRFYADGNTRWNGTPISGRMLDEQISTLMSRGDPVRLMLRADNKTAWSVVSNALSIIGKCTICEISDAEESEQPKGSETLLTVEKGSSSFNWTS
jgi:biopolymer transport protein ExbD